MGLSGAGALFSGLVFRRHTWRVLMLIGCLALFEIMLIVLFDNLGLGRSERKIMLRLIGIFSGVAIMVISFKIKKTED